jgi:hypothetical protein
MESVVTAIPEIDVKPKVTALARLLVAVLVGAPPTLVNGLNVTKNLKLRNGSVIKFDRLLMIVGSYLLSPSG